MLLEGLSCKVRFRGTECNLSCTQYLSCLCPHPIPEGCLEAFLEDASLSPTVLHLLGLSKLFIGREEEGLVSFCKGDLCISRAGSLCLLPPPNPLPGGRAMATHTRSLLECPREPPWVPPGPGRSTADQHRDCCTRAAPTSTSLLAPAYLLGAMLIQNL